MENIEWASIILRGNRLFAHKFPFVTVKSVTGLGASGAVHTFFIDFNSEWRSSTYFLSILSNSAWRRAMFFLSDLKSGFLISFSTLSNASIIIASAPKLSIRPLLKEQKNKGGFNKKKYIKKVPWQKYMLCSSRRRSISDRCMTWNMTECHGILLVFFFNINRNSHTQKYNKQLMIVEVKWKVCKSILRIIALLHWFLHHVNLNQPWHKNSQLVNLSNLITDISRSLS